MQKMMTCLWFKNEALEAAKFYVSIFKNSKIVSVTNWPMDGHSGKKGDVLVVNFELEGREFMALNGGEQEKPNPSVSIAVSCEDQMEIDYLWKRLSEGGREVQCGWLTDKYGFSWQIAPSVVFNMLQDPDTAKAARAMTAFGEMVKFDLAALKKAYEGK